MTTVADPHVVLYDGLCGVCNRFNRFVLDRDRQGRFVFAALQSATARALLEPHGASPDDLDTVWVVARGGGPERALSRSDAVLFVLRELGGVWSMAAWLRVLPRPVRDLGYRVFARLRYRLLGRHDTCPLPRPGETERFLDV
ncbi:MAG TPA: DCC1-like thiol-disulfide oxidoreductase family protein [Planctomycetota bacterium]|nr:DCC1-like thiol-disulfide oxidoreductase family protein [Planctomycetota bacterium]